MNLYSFLQRPPPAEQWGAKVRVVDADRWLWTPVVCEVQSRSTFRTGEFSKGTLSFISKDEVSVSVPSLVVESLPFPNLFYGLLPCQIDFNRALKSIFAGEMWEIWWQSFCCFSFTGNGTKCDGMTPSLRNHPMPVSSSVSVPSWTTAIWCVVLVCLYVINKCGLQQMR